MLIKIHKCLEINYFHSKSQNQEEAMKNKETRSGLKHPKI